MICKKRPATSAKKRTFERIRILVGNRTTENTWLLSRAGSGRSTCAMSSLSDFAGRISRRRTPFLMSAAVLQRLLPVEVPAPAHHNQLCGAQVVLDVRIVLFSVTTRRGKGKQHAPFMQKYKANKVLSAALPRLRLGRRTSFGIGTSCR